MSLTVGLLKNWGYNLKFVIIATPMMCAVEKRYERMPRRRLTLERSVVKHPLYPDLVTGWGV
jgi:hypothetical protein